MADSDAPKKLGRYEIVGELGKGAMGIVYEGYDPNIDRRVAIKTARKEVLEASGMADELMERFLREAQAAGKLNHPNIITIYDAGKEGDMAYIAMEYLDGGDLDDQIKRNKRMDVNDIVKIAASICEALARAHEKGIVHRDIKPANIMTLPNGDIKVADFGIAHVSDSELTQEGSMIGTPHYMSPEQFMGQKVDGRSDLFAVAIIAYQLLTGERPFSGDAISAIMHNVLKTEPVDPKELNFAVSESLSKVVMKALKKSPNDRYQTGDEMAAAILESMKPNPDPAILQLTAAAASEATVVSQDAAATVLREPAGNSFEATAQISPGDSIPEAAPLEEAESQVDTGQRKTAAKPDIKKFVIAGVAVVVVVIGSIVVLMGGDNGGVEPNGNGTGETGSDGTVRLEQAELTVYFAFDQEMVNKAKENEDGRGPSGAGCQFGDVDVTIRDESGSPLFNGLLKEGDPAYFAPKENFAAVTITAQADGFKLLDHPYIISASSELYPEFGHEIYMVPDKPMTIEEWNLRFNLE